MKAAKGEFGKVDPPGIAEFMKRVGGMDGNSLDRFGAHASSSYETLRNDPRVTLEEYGELLAAGTTWDRICAVEKLCEFFWLTSQGQMTVADCFKRLAELAAEGSERNENVVTN